MKNCNYNGNRSRLLVDFRIVKMLIVMLIIFSFGLFCVKASASNGKPVSTPMVEKCKIDLAKRFKVTAKQIKVVSVKTVIWPDASLGMPQIGKMYAQMMTPGSQVILAYKNTHYLYTVSSKAFRYGGPTYLWAYSFLYSQPVPNEPNLNRDLYQCSLLGTNSVRIASGVADYYPQDKGVVIIKRRMSRSSHELLYLTADGSGKAQSLSAAFDFGEAAFNDSQKMWAGFVREAVGGSWSVMINSIGQESAKAQTIPLPEGVMSGQIAWSGDRLMILTRKGEQTSCFETSLQNSDATWKVARVEAFPGTMDYMLNKSETLEINQIEKGGKWSVEIARVWFTGDRTIIATIEDFTLRSHKFLGGRLAYVWGEKDSEKAICTVDIATGEIIPLFGKVNGDIKPFQSPIRRNPMVLPKTK